jgi:hypothetical protein
MDHIFNHKPEYERRIAKMKFATVTAVLFSAAALLQGAENLMQKPETVYEVFPGQWNKSLLKSEKFVIDPDLDRATGKRKGMLADKKTFQKAVCYNYHRTPLELSFVTIEIDLGKPFTLGQIKVAATENNSMYTPSKVVVSGSADKVTFRELGSSAEWTKDPKNKYVLTASLSGEWKDCRFLRIKVFCEKSWINITEIEVYDK